MLQTPQTKKDSIIETVSGFSVADPYRWLEVSDDVTVQEWTRLQNTYTESQLHGPAFSTFSEELAKNFKTVTFTNPFPVRGRYFYCERQPDENQTVLYMKQGREGTPVTLVDPNLLKKDGTTTLDVWSPSRNGKYVVFGLSEGGDEMATLKIKNTDTGEVLPDVIGRSRHSQIVWTRDDTGFFYLRNPDAGTVPTNEEHLHMKVYYHVLGDISGTDTLIFGKDRPHDDMLNLSYSRDGNYLAIQVSTKWTSNDVYIYNTTTRTTTPLFVGIDAKFSIIFLQDRVLVDTNHQANNYKLLWAPITDFFKPLDGWQVFVAERPFPTESTRVTKSKIFIEYLVNACSEVVEFDHAGREVGKLPLPPFSTLAGISGSQDEEEFFYGVEGFTFPKIIYRYDPATTQYSLFRKMDNPITPEDYEVQQVWYSSKDSTRVPMFVFHKKGVERTGGNPTILWGYGGFAISEMPSFMKTWIPWLERGGIFAIANIRGGGEFGQAWHLAGIKEKKQNSFDDFIAAAEFLISEKYTDTAHLGILGGSNGGLLVAAVMIQRPELFAAVCSNVPLTDMVRFPQFGIAARWVHEYGNPQVSADLENILKWSPYHNVQADVHYPNSLFKTAEKDSRVHPMHARKMVAALQAVQAEGDQASHALLFVQQEAGHGSGKPIYKVVEGQALNLAFFAKYLGMSV